MKKPYAVKVNGKWYRPGEEIPEEKKVASTEEIVEKAVESVEIPVETEKQPAEAEAQDEKKVSTKKSTKKE